MCAVIKGNWGIERFKATDIRDNLNMKKFVVPRYQRGLVWQEQQKMDLFDSIRRGMPFGSLLLFKKDGDKAYRIIDGLQRSFAIKSFIENPSKYFNEDDIDKEVINRIANRIAKLENIPDNDALKASVVDILTSWVKTHNGMDEIQDIQYAAFGAKIVEQYPKCASEVFDYGNLIQPMLKGFKDLCKEVCDTEIPAIVMHGGEELLPELFERINSKGTFLSKYQIFAAMWLEDKFKISEKNSRIVNFNCDRYDLMLDKKELLENYSPIEFKRERKLTTFELAFGMGKYLKTEWPHLFGKSTEDDAIDSVGFSLLTACVGLKHSEKSSLSKVLKERIGEAGINDFIDALFDAVKEVDELIGKYSRFKLNGRSDANIRPLHTENQILSIVTSVFLLKHAKIDYTSAGTVANIQFTLSTERREWKNYKKELKKNIGKTYIQEILQRRWGNSGDKKLDLIIENPRYYTKDVARADFEKILDAFFTTINNERNESVSVASPKEPERLVLSAIYMNIFSADEMLNGSKYDIEHLATKKLMKQHARRLGIRLPISSIGNLCLLPEYVNRSKREMSLYADQQYLDRLADKSISLKIIEEKFSFTSKADLEWLEDDNLNASELRKNYMNFIKNHFDKMKKHLMRYFDKL